MPRPANEDAPVQYRSLTRQTAPAVEPVTLAEAKAHLRVDADTDDTYIGTLITAAREWVEQYLDRALIHQQYVMRLDSFPYEFELPRPPMVASGTATTVAVTYTLGDDSTATLSASQYRVDRSATPGVVRQLRAGTWPANLDDQNAVTVTWWAGYGTSGASVPAAIRHAMLMLVGHWYDGSRSGVLTGSISKEIEFGVKSLLDSQRWGSYR
jgi:uncharacterized phiE125 gp8 family phage protein